MAQQTWPKLTDDAVSRLPLQAGRAELLEEIMSTVAPDRQTAEPSTPRRQRSRWLAPLAVAAAVAGIAASTLWWQGLGDGESPGRTPNVAAQPKASTTAEGGFRAVLDAPGWTVTSTESGSDGYGEVYYEKGDASFTISWYAAESYDSYVEDREHIVDPPAPGEPVEVLGAPAQLWAYSRNDHTVIRSVSDGHWMELRGSGMDEAAYRALLGAVRLVGRSDFEAALPDEFVTDTERADTVAAILQGIEGVSGAGYPSGRDVPPKSDQQDPYQLGAAVAGSYACAWLVEFEQATRADDSARAAEAARVLGTSRDWPVLHQMNATGDYPEVLWDYADEVGAGRVPEGYRGGLGCP